MSRYEIDTTDDVIEPVLAPPQAPTDDVIERWWQETFCNIGLDTQLSNRFRAAADRLKILIAETR